MSPPPGTGDSVPRPLGLSAFAPGLLKKAGSAKRSRAVPATESALGSHPCVALSSAPPAGQFSGLGTQGGTAREGIHAQRFLFARGTTTLHVEGADGSGPRIGGLLQQQAVVAIDADASIGGVAHHHRAA